MRTKLLASLQYTQLAGGGRHFGLPLFGIGLLLAGMVYYQFFYNNGEEEIDQIDEAAPEVEAVGIDGFGAILIGDIYWMNSNLNIETEGSFCYETNPGNCDTYGRLYTWEAASRICDSIGRRLPSKADWINLAKSYGGLEKAHIADTYEALVDRGESYFNALLGGDFVIDEAGSSPHFRFINEKGYYWTSDVDKEGNASYREFSPKNLSFGSEAKTNGASCRCVQAAE